jgi:pSer/pThr/pTyr-binding forkhead associated (FHA) protein
MFAHLSITEPGRSNRTVVVNGTMTIGRDAQNDILLSAASVSRWHVMLFRDADGLLLVDLESTNGTLVNGLAARPEEPMRLADGDVIQFGETVARYAVLPEPSRLSSPPSRPPWPIQ